jgi:D-alanine-D-alanine ligase-like ATP-grasp enzyme
MESQILLVINTVTPSIKESVEKLKLMTDFKNLKIVCVTNKPVIEENQEDSIIAVHFDNDDELRDAVRPYYSKIIAVACRGDGNIQYLRKIVKHLPISTPVATEESLAIATNKRLMRQVLREKNPEISPAFVQVTGSDKENIDLIEATIEYPVIVKPANLMSSMLIQSCETREKLQRALEETFDQISAIYEREGRLEVAQVIVEEFLAGDFYSVDAYVQEQGQVDCCPVVGYIAAKQLGIDDFYLYKRFIPTALNQEEEMGAYTVSKKIIEAIGLTHSSAHIELILTKNGWKVIEIGPRIGRFRNRMYRLSYDIDHSTNDVAIHLGLKPQIPTELIAYTTCYSIYPNSPGVLKEITGFEEAGQLEAVTHINRMVDDGNYCKQAKHGGKALAEITISSKNKQLYDKATRYIEENVRAVIGPE